MTTIDYNDDVQKRAIGFLTRMGIAFDGWRQRAAHRRSMHALTAYDARLLRDVGLNPEDFDDSARYRAIWLNPL